MLRGESPFHPDFGARLAQYFDAFRASPWLGHFLKLDVIRQAAIPYTDEVMQRQYTPLQCVDRVWGVEVLADSPKVSTPEEKCIDFPEQKYISEAGKKGR
jgi:hypothetical protein